jgi:hypothetical protein
MEHRDSPPSHRLRPHRLHPGRSVAAAVALSMLAASTGCASWEPVRAMGVPGKKLDDALQGREMRYHDGGKIVEGEIRRAETPYVLVETRDPITGEKKRDMLDLRFADHPEMKVPDKTGKIVGIVAGSTAGAVVVGIAIGLVVNGFAQLGHTLSGLH